MSVSTDDVSDQQVGVTNGDLRIVEEDELAKEATGFVAEEEEIFMFDSSLVQNLDFSNLTCFNPPISPSQPGQGLRVRPLSTADFERGRW